MTFTDIEYFLIIIAIVVVFLLGMKKRTNTLDLGHYCVDKDLTTTLKGVACVFILMGHYGQRNFDPETVSGFSKLIYWVTAKMALVWFMFFSGYGLSLKDYSEHIIYKDWSLRVKKVYLPLFFVGVISLMFTTVVNSQFFRCQIIKMPPPNETYICMSYSFNSVVFLILNILGVSDWYVMCILVFYTLFYISQFLARKFKYSQSLCLGMLMLCYFILAYSFVDKANAHWYRLPWAFMFGHIAAVWKSNSMKVNIGLVLMFMLTNIVINEPINTAIHAFSMLVLFAMCLLNRKYTHKSRILIFIGSISYFFYLVHQRICYPLMILLGANSVVIWILLTIVVAYYIDTLYKRVIPK